MFPNLAETIASDSGLYATSLRNVTGEHLKTLVQRFEFYFPKEQDPRKGNGWICNPFLPLKDNLSVNLEDNLLQLAGDVGLKKSTRQYNRLSLIQTRWDRQNLLVVSEICTNRCQLHTFIWAGEILVLTRISSRPTRVAYWHTCQPI